MEMKWTRIAAGTAVAGLMAMAGQAAADPENPTGAPDGYVGAGHQGGETQGFAVDSFNAPRNRGVKAPLLPKDIDGPAGEGVGIGPLDRTGSVEVEFDGAPTAEQAELAALIDASWQAGDFEAGRRFIDQLRATGFDGGMGFSWDQDEQTEKFRDVFSPDRRVGSPRIDPNGYELDFAPGGTLHALVAWPDGWSLNVSQNGGFSWSETYFWFGNNGVVDVDLAVVEGFAYVGYIWTGAADQARLRRCDESTGAVDGVYGFQTIFTATGGEAPLTDIAMEGNADSVAGAGFAGRIYMMALKSDNSLFFGWDASSDGTTFIDNSPTTTDAIGPIDFAWNEEFTTYSMAASYRNSNNQVVCTRASLPGGVGFVWDELITPSGSLPLGFGDTACISAYADTFMVGFDIDPATGIQQADYVISYDAGDSWLVSGGSPFNDDPDPWHVETDVAIALGHGVSQVVTNEVGPFDPISFRHREAYAPGFWSNGLTINSQDSGSARPVALEALPAPANVGRYGVLYEAVTGVPTELGAWFDRIEVTCPGDFADSSGFGPPDGQVDFGDFFALSFLAGACPGNTPGCNGDLADTTGFGPQDGQIDFGDFFALSFLAGPC